MRIIFMGTPTFAVPALHSLISSAHEVVAAYSQPPRPAGRGMKLTASPIHQLAEQHGIPVFTPASLKSEQAQAEFASHSADIAVVAAYGLLLPQAILNAPRLGCINIHPSDLPRWRGAAPIQRTIMAGDTNTACCIMQMEAGLDTGPVLARKTYEISANMTAGELHDAMSEMGARMALDVVNQFATNQPPNPKPQTPSGVTYACKITKQDQIIDFSQAAAIIVNQIRALSPSPGALMVLAGEPLKIFAARSEAGDAAKPIGSTLDDGLLINSGGGTALRILELQRPGKSRQNASDFLKGSPIPAGICAKIDTVAP